nr:MAG TPA: hypothetical protein [Caudoviricetes sp.]
MGSLGTSSNRVKIWNCVQSCFSCSEPSISWAAVSPSLPSPANPCAQGRAR